MNWYKYMQKKVLDLTNTSKAWISPDGHIYNLEEGFLHTDWPEKYEEFLTQMYGLDFFKDIKGQQDYFDRLLDNKWIRISVYHNIISCIVKDFKDIINIKVLEEILFDLLPPNSKKRIVINFSIQNRDSEFIWEDFIKSNLNLSDFLQTYHQVIFATAQKNIPTKLELVDLQDIIHLYQWEYPYGVYISQTRMGQPVTENEYLEHLMAKQKLEPLVNKLGQQFYSLVRTVGYNSVSFADPIEPRCPQCFSWFVKEGDQLYCDNCDFDIKQEDFFDYIDAIEQFSEQNMDFITKNELYTDYGMEHVSQFITMWTEAQTLSEKIIALQYIINALHVSGPLVALFIKGKPDMIIHMLDRLSKNFSPTMKWPFRGDYGVSSDRVVNYG